MSNGPPVLSKDQQLDNAREAYRAALSLWAYEGNTIWAKLAAMVYANTILLATLGLIITSSRSRELFVLRVAIAVLGLGLCIAWLLLTVRSFDYHSYWILSAREIEERHLSPAATVSRGAEFAKGKQITFEMRAKPQLCQLRWLSKVAHVETVIYGIICVFALAYVLTVVLPYLPVPA